MAVSDPDRVLGIVAIPKLRMVAVAGPRIDVATAIEALVSQRVDYADVETGTAARAARLIAQLL